MGRRHDLSTKYGLYIIGEQVRVQLTTVGLIKDQRHHLRKHRKCFVAKDAIDWLVRMRHVDSRPEAVMSMAVLQEFNVIHHVTDDQEFKDKNGLYRFTKDDDTYKVDRNLTIFYRGLELHDKMKRKGNHMMRDFYHRGELHPQAFYGSDVVDFLQEMEGAADRDSVVQRLQELVTGNVIKHLNGDYRFADDRLIYEFCFDFHKTCLLNHVIDLLDKFDSFSVGQSEGSTNEKSEGTDDSSDEVDDGMDASTTSANTEWSCPDTDESIRSRSSSRKRASQDAKSTEQRLERILQMYPDNVGYGLILRGCSPCFVHSVAPLGPAARAKVKVGQPVSSINGQSVIQMSHDQVGTLIARSQGERMALRLGVLLPVTTSSTPSHS